MNGFLDVVVRHSRAWSKLLTDDRRPRTDIHEGSETMRTKRIVIAASLCALAFTRLLVGGELTKVVRAKPLTGGAILLVNAARATYDGASSTGCIVRRLETDRAKVAALRKRLLGFGYARKPPRGSFGLLSEAITPSLCSKAEKHHLDLWLKHDE